MTMKSDSLFFLLIFVGGGLGATARFLIVHFWGIEHTLSTLAINFLACFLIGLIDKLLPHSKSESHKTRNLRGLLTTGFLGGFSTLAALSSDETSIGWIVFTVCGSVAFALLGHLIVSAWRRK